MKKGDVMLAVVLKGLMGMLEVAALLLLIFCWANNCGIG